MADTFDPQAITDYLNKYGVTFGPAPEMSPEDIYQADPSASVLGYNLNKGNDSFYYMNEPGTENFVDFKADPNTGKWNYSIKQPGGGGWFDKALNWVGDKVLPAATIGAIGAITGGAALSAAGGAGAAGASAGTAGAATGAGGAATGLGGAATGTGALGGAAGTAGSLGSGFYGALGSSAADAGIGANLGLGGLSSIGAGSVGAAGLAPTLGGMSAAEMASAAYPALGSTVAGGASGALGSGFYGTGINDIGALMGTSGNSPFSLGSGLSSVTTGDLAQAAANAPGWFQTGLQKLGKDALKNQLKQMLSPAQQPQMQQGGNGSMPAPMYIQPIKTGMAASEANPGALTSFATRYAPQGAQTPEQQLTNLQQTSGVDPANYKDYTSYLPNNVLPSGQNSGTLAGYELWKVLNSNQ